MESSQTSKSDETFFSFDFSPILNTRAKVKIYYKSNDKVNIKDV